jgi:phospholipid/cholesterol/gamma-HCH transport system substrate-binding protein
MPLNDGYNWKGDPNATLSGQDIPQPRDPAVPGAGPPGPALSPPTPIAVVEYDPATGTYIGPDGRQCTQSDLAKGAEEGQTWQSMLTPPTGN